MPSRVRSHLRSNVVGYVALFVALSSSAYAVNGPLAGRNTVGSADIINGEVRSVDVTDNSLKAADIGADSVIGSNIDESTLGQVPLAGSVADGAIGSSKFGTFTRRSASVVVSGGTAGNGTYDTADASVSCQSGETAFGGHAFWTAGKGADDELPLIEFGYSYTGSGRPVGFSAEGGNDTAEDTTLQAVVFCLQP